MKLILKEDVQSLGFKDDIVNVKNGYGRNFLIPKGKAIIATSSALKIIFPFETGKLYSAKRALP